MGVGQPHKPRIRRASVSSCVKWGSNELPSPLPDCPISCPDPHPLGLRCSEAFHFTCPRQHSSQPPPHQLPPGPRRPPPGPTRPTGRGQSYRPCPRGPPRAGTHARGGRGDRGLFSGSGRTEPPPADLLQAGELVGQVQRVRGRRGGVAVQLQAAAEDHHLPCLFARRPRREMGPSLTGSRSGSSALRILAPLAPSQRPQRAHPESLRRLSRPRRVPATAGSKLFALLPGEGLRVEVEEGLHRQ